MMKSILALGVISFPLSALKAETKTWLNRWDASCYDNSGLNTCQNTWYKTTEGSHIVTWEVFISLEAAQSNQRFASRDVLSAFGFVYPASAEQAYLTDALPKLGEFAASALPLGLLRDDAKKSSLNLKFDNYVGISCSGCHTGSIQYQGQEYLVEAGQGNVDFNGFLLGLANALEANQKGEKNKRFLARFPGKASDAKKMLERDIETVRSYTNRNTMLHPNGPSRLDAIGSILNEVLVHQAKKEKNHSFDKLSAPVSLPYIWDAMRLSCVQTNCLSQNPLTRNIGQNIGSFGLVNLETNILTEKVQLGQLADGALGENLRKVLGDSPLFDTTTKIPNLVKLEEALDKIAAPQWQDTALPALDEKLAQAGKAVYAAQCAQCHVDVKDGVSADELAPANENGFAYWNVQRVPYQTVGTDATFIETYGPAKRETGLLGEILKAKAPDREYTYVDRKTGETITTTIGERVPTEYNALKLLGLTTSVTFNRYMNTKEFQKDADRFFAELSAEEAKKQLGLRYTFGQSQSSNLDAAVYRAKPLNGIAFTAPFLHNGSVPSLFDLLQKPELRPKRFKVGSREFDPARVGFVSDLNGPGSFVFDTQLKGNSNVGHSYGSELSGEDKTALLEYLKSL